MKKSRAFIMALGLTALFSACSHHNDDNPVGSWTSAAPQSVTETVDGATSATKTVSIDFKSPVGDAEGEVILTADYDVTVPFVTDSVSDKTSYQVVAIVKGTWTKDGDSHDDYLLTFDRNTLSVNGTDAPELGPVTDDFLNSLAQYTSIEDVEVSKDGTHMTFETSRHEVKYHFVRK